MQPKILPTGTISMAQVASELGLSQTGINLNHSSVRRLAGKTSGTISMNDLRGKANWAPTHTLNVLSTNHYGVLVYGFNRGDTYNANFGSISPSSVNGTTILHMVAEENNGRAQIRMNNSMSDPEIHIEMSNGGTKYIFEKASSSSSYYNLSSGNKAAWLEMMQDFHDDEISFKMWTW